MYVLYAALVHYATCISPTCELQCLKISVLATVFSELMLLQCVIWPFTTPGAAGTHSSDYVVCRFKNTVL